MWLAMPGRWQLGLVPFPGQFESLVGGPGPLSPVPEAGGAPHIWILPILCLQLQCSALVHNHGCQCFIEINQH